MGTAIINPNIYKKVWWNGKRPYNKILNKVFQNIKTGETYIARRSRGVKGICLASMDNYFHVSHYMLRKYYKEI